MNFSEQLDQFVEREAVKYYYVETATQEEKSMYRQISIIDYKAGQASLKPIVLKLYEAIQFLPCEYLKLFGTETTQHYSKCFKCKTLAEIERMIGEGKSE